MEKIKKVFKQFSFTARIKGMQIIKLPGGGDPKGDTHAAEIRLDVLRGEGDVPKDAVSFPITMCVSTDLARFLRPGSILQHAVSVVQMAEIPDLKGASLDKAKTIVKRAIDAYKAAKGIAAKLFKSRDLIFKLKDILKKNPKELEDLGKKQPEMKTIAALEPQQVFESAEDERRQAKILRDELVAKDTEVKDQKKAMPDGGLTLLDEAFKTEQAAEKAGKAEKGYSPEVLKPGVEDEAIEKPASKALKPEAPKK